MKSLAELQAIKDKMKDKVILREGVNGIRVVVGMATCGIAAGARPVLNTLVEEVNKEGLTDKVTVSQTGCIGICQLEPIVEVFEAGKDKVGKRGVVKDPNTHIEVLERAVGFAKNAGFGIVGLEFSPIKGPQGNIEYLMVLTRKEPKLSVSPEEIKKLVESSHDELDKKGVEAN